MSSKKIVITGGGTGGHVFPALAMAEELRRREFQVLYVGSSTGMEAKLVPPKGFAFYPIRSGAVKNQNFLKVIKTLFSVVLSVGWAIRFLRREKPAAVLGVGGYVSVPTCLAAFLLRIPLYLQEQNVSVGIANRFLGRLSHKIFLGFAQATTSFSKSKCIVTGNPIREAFFEPGFPQFDPNRQCLLIFGGSQGARVINDAIVSLLPRLTQTFPGISLIHQTGEKDYERIRAAYQPFGGKHQVHAFIGDMVSVYAASSLVLSRSGALTVSEIIQVARPAIFVPYPRRGQNDQTANAYWLKTVGVAEVVEQGEGFTERLWTTLAQTFRPDRLRQMSENFSALHRTNALVSIGDQIQMDFSPQVTAH
jgi:UDP-N-acetylglucosamine--N-acetylmuramyl-(pentapeptide) pyrophosphoryl-undecaprenol N-acetylglucosamine transferase